MKRTAIIVLCVSAMLPATIAHAREQRGDRETHRRDTRDHRDDRRADSRDYRSDRHDRDRYDQGRYDGRRPARQVEWRNWRRGDRFDHRYARDYRLIDYRRYRGLRPPPRGYHYVRSGNDAVLIGIASGIVAAVVANAIR